MQLRTSWSPKDFFCATRPELPAIRQREEEFEKYVQLPVFYFNAAEAIVIVIVMSTVAPKRLLTTMGIEKVEQWFLEGKVRETVL